ncbi:protein jagged-1b-like [Tigriopus californicus]|uniref:protein jagged-1b-like n=1 Tax=Tigriopus californicus TaxID=6832 RepID=UPI0027D9F8EC|nr:protein jagged-1b-like [Tigriopus californicus]
MANRGLTFLTFLVIFTRLAHGETFLSSSGGSRQFVFTPLRNDELPCVAENLRHSHRYICDDEANVICLSGWREDPDWSKRDLRNPCPIPICDYHGETCQHGQCVRPDVCACEVGWQGHLCDTCIPLPGCIHGSCNATFECNCDCNDQGVQLWEGAFCEQPACPDCHPNHGFCFEPFECQCHEGWQGPDCQECVKLPGCVHGSCEDGKPHSCQCDEGWTGHLCDQPQCGEGCHHENGFCIEPDTCICKAGWQGPSCSECVPYWICPEDGYCYEPNQCICNSTVTDKDRFDICNREKINGPMHKEQEGDCSLKCTKFTAYELPMGPPIGNRSTECSWGQNEGLCTPKQSDCLGNQEWEFDVNLGIMELDVESCKYGPAFASLTTTGTTPSTITAPPPRQVTRWW